MAWILCRCAMCPNGCRRQKEIGPPRTASYEYGLCDSCKSKGHCMPKGDRPKYTVEVVKEHKPRVKRTLIA